MPAALRLPIDFLTFWFIEAPWSMLQYFASLNKAFFQLFSLPLLLRTFFQPIKNEYRQGLVGFSIGMGIVIKSGIIFVDLLLLVLILAVELVILVGFLAWPFATVALLIL